ncbi:MAG: metallophosphoesterase [Proteobacteria bacterium]|nr:metallophosphoesterase [Pseudomonadota bacterium]
MNTIMLYCLIGVLSVSLLVIIVSYYLGQYVYSLKSLGSIPFINNAANIGWIQKQPEQESFSFLVIGDIQSGHLNLSRQILAPAKNTCAFAVQTGDLVSHADSGHYALALYELKKSSLDIPLFVIPGNHDVKGNPGLFETYFRLKQFFFTWSNCLFIFFDNALGAPYDRLFAWLEEILEKYQGKVRRTFIFIHRPPIDWEHGEPRPEMKNYSRFFELQKQFRIDYVFSGHLHDYRELELNGTTYISNGLESDQKGRASNESFVTTVHVLPDTVITKQVTITPSFTDTVLGRITDSLVAHVYPSLRLS